VPHTRGKSASFNSPRCLGWMAGHHLTIPPSIARPGQLGTAHQHLQVLQALYHPALRCGHTDPVGMAPVGWWCRREHQQTFEAERLFLLVKRSRRAILSW
jgi:hypothetical protein